MKKIISFTLLGGLLLGISPQSSFAMARYIMPIWGGVQFKPDQNSKTAVLYESDLQKETIIFKPEFTGNAKDFGIVIPTPTKPEISEAPKNIFNDLEQETNQPRYGIMPMLRSAEMQAVTISQEKKVEIIEVKNVGQYTSIIIKANDAKALSDWLQKYQFNYDAATKSTLGFYIKQTGSYFTLLRVTVPAWEDRLRESTKVETGTLDPIAISFKTARPMLPWRIMAGQLPLSKMTLYTISDDTYYVPQTDVQYAGKINKLTQANYLPGTSASDMSYGDVYNVNKKTLIRHAIVFNPKKISADLYFTKGSKYIDLIPVSTKTAVTIKSKVDSRLGIIPSKAKAFSVTGPYNGFIHSDILLEKGDKGSMVIGLQEFLVNQGVLQYKQKVKPNGVFDQKTEEALVQFQSNNGLTQTGVTDPDTKNAILDLLKQTNYPPIYY